MNEVKLEIDILFNNRGGTGLNIMANKRKNKSENYELVIFLIYNKIYM